MMLEKGLSVPQVSYHIPSLQKSFQNRFHCKDLITLNSVLDACSRSGEWQVAVQLLCDFEAQGLQVDEVSMSAVVSACEEVKDAQKGKKTLKKHGILRKVLD